MTCQNAADESRTGPTALGYVCLLSCFGNLALRSASSPRRTCRLRPYGLSTFGIRDTGQNTSQVQDAFRSLHYVAETCLPSSACPAVTKISTPHFGDRPRVTWGQAPKSVPKNLIIRILFAVIVKMVKIENTMRNILVLILLRLKKE